MRPVILLTMGRSRSSMTAEIFRRHGVFFGNSWGIEDRQRIGYNEHRWIKTKIRNWRKELYINAILKDKGSPYPEPDCDFATEWIAELKRNGWDEVAPWGVKVDVFCYNLFEQWPSSHIGIWRNEDDIAESCLRVLRHRTNKKEDWLKIIRAHHALIDALNIPVINTDELVAGNYKTLEAAFDHVGLEFDPSIAKGTIGAKRK